jgi:hypothetical protein
VKAIVLSLALVAGWAGAASAQESSSTLPLLKVRPSGVDRKAEEARAREDRLLRRMQENDYLFRNICIQCGGGVNRAGSNAPFYPVQSLPAASRPPAEPEAAMQP